jgi:hypothetical protein
VRTVALKRCNAYSRRFRFTGPQRLLYCSYRYCAMSGAAAGAVSRSEALTEAFVCHLDRVRVRSWYGRIAAHARGGRRAPQLRSNGGRRPRPAARLGRR